MILVAKGLRPAAEAKRFSSWWLLARRTILPHVQRVKRLLTRNPERRVRDGSRLAVSSVWPG
jgi:hypothetical protein